MAAWMKQEELDDEDDVTNVNLLCVNKCMKHIDVRLVLEKADVARTLSAGVSLVHGLSALRS